MMSLGRAEELAEAMGTSLTSSTIEWGANLQICEILEAQPSLSPAAMRGIRAALQRGEPVPTLLALTLLEMIVKNCGIESCRAIDATMARALHDVVKHRESWQYGLGRNLHKLGGGLLPGGTGIDEAERTHWLRARQKVLEILQLSADAFLLREGELQPLFSLYKQLRKEGYEFPGRTAAGAGAAAPTSGGTSGLALVRGSHESPAFLAGMEASGGAPPSPASAPAPAPPSPAPTAPAPAPAATLGSEEVTALRAAVAALQGGAEGEEALDEEERRRLLAKLKAAVPRVQQAIEESAEAASEELDEVILHGLIALHEDMNTVLARPAARSASAELPDLLQGSACAAAAQPVSSEELEGMRQTAAELEAARSEEGGAPDAELLARGRAACRRLRSLLESDTSELEDEAKEEVTHVLCRLEELLDDESDGEAPLPPRPSAKEPSVQEQEMYDALMARFLQDQEVQDARRQEEADARLAFLLASGLEPHRAQAQAYSPGQAWSPGWPMPQVQMGMPMMPTRAAPPARVIQASGETPELLIGEDKEAKFPTPTGGSSGSTFTGGLLQAGEALASMGSAAAGAVAAGFAGQQQPLSDSLLGQEGGASSSSSKAKTWSKWDPRWAPNSSGLLRSLGESEDPPDEYGELGGASPAMVERAEPSALETAKGLLPWKRKKKETQEALLSRVRVDSDWELVRPREERPYWHNSTTGHSQWQPPSVLADRGA